jgi:hypothetical protein
VNPEQQIKDLIREVCSREFIQLRSIVLTGSMARQESFFYEENGFWQCEGDAECLLVFDFARTLPSDKKVANVAQHISHQLMPAGIRCPISLSAVTIKYFRKMQPHIFGYELRTCGDVIWGETAVLGAIPAFEAQDIPKEDALRILANRLIELLECAASDLHSNGPVSPALRYKTTKLYLDMASSYLIFQNAFEAGYCRRAEILEQLAATQPDHPFQCLANFVGKVRAATRHKLGCDAGYAAGEVSEVFAAIRNAKALWHWELNQLTNSPTTMPRQSIYRQLRAWAFVARKCGGQRTLRYWPRWLTGGCRVSPRYSIYRAATEVVFGLEPALCSQTGSTLQFAEFARLLPIVQRRQHTNWRQIAAEIAWNYHEFLEATRA